MKKGVSRIPWKRIIAYLIDGVIISVVIVFPTEAFSLSGHWSKGMSLNDLYEGMMATSNGASVVFVAILVAMLTLLYWAVLERYNKGQTVGKMAMKLKVESLTKKLSFRQTIIRNIAKLSSLLLFLDTLYLIVKKQDQRFSDTLAKTRVVAIK